MLTSDKKRISSLFRTAAGMSPPQTSDETRARIVSEAERLFRHYGYTKTTVADIAGACAMSPANVYRFFSSKLEINNAICCAIISEFEVRMRQIADMDAPASDRLSMLIEALAANTAEMLSHDRKVHDMVAVAMEENWGAVQHHLKFTLALIAGIIASGIEKGEFKPQDPDQAARCAHFALVGFKHPVVAAQCGGTPGMPTPAGMAEFILSALRT
jgi:AcrR family transcriptional regulator